MKKNNFLNLIAFLALLIVAVLFTISGVLPHLGIQVQGVAINILDTIRSVFILIIIGCFSYNFVKTKAKWVKIIYWISIAIYVAGTVLIWFK